MRGNFALQDREVNNLVRPGAIAGRVNMRRARLHVLVGDDAGPVGSDAGLLKAESSGVRCASEREQNLLRVRLGLSPAVQEGDDFCPPSR